MGSVVNSSSSDVEKDHTVASQAGATASPQIPEGRTVTYQLILRHLAKFRDGATALLDLFSTHAPAADADQAAPVDSGASAPAVPKPAGQEPKSPLEIRIERHMSRVDQALRQIRDLNPERKKKLDLAPEVRDQLRRLLDTPGVDRVILNPQIAGPGAKPLEVVLRDLEQEILTGL